MIGKMGSRGGWEASGGAGVGRGSPRQAGGETRRPEVGWNGASAVGRKKKGIRARLSM